jgi:hypothetical protein
MSEERIRILNMVANGKITPQEAERLLDALNNPVAEASPPPQRNPKFIRVQVTGNDNIDIRVPIGVLRTGIKLTALIPPLAMAHINEHVKERGFDFDLGHIKKEDVDELLANLGELEVGVKSRNGDNVRIYCE